MVKATPNEIKQSINAFEPDAKPKVKNTDKKMGVWKNGKLVLQTRDYDAINNLKNKLINDFSNNVWVAPVGSFEMM